tara:strand:- start:507 stop:761 length:255 start_codon:yes stop_codon:yes gene_type:complete
MNATEMKQAEEERKAKFNGEFDSSKESASEWNARNQAEAAERKSARKAWQEAERAEERAAEDAFFSRNKKHNQANGRGGPSWMR